MEPIRIEIAVKAENGKAEAVNAAKAESPKETPKETREESVEERIEQAAAWRFRTAWKSCRRDSMEMMREFCRDFADTQDDWKAGKIAGRMASVRNTVNLLCIDAALRLFLEEGK